MVARESLKEDPKVMAIVNGYKHPTLVEIGPLAKARGITSAIELWDFFDLIRSMWHEQKDTTDPI